MPSTSIEKLSSSGRVTSVKSTKQELASEIVLLTNAMIGLGSDGKIYLTHIGLGVW